MTVPFGIYLRYYFNCDLKKTVILSFILSLFFEPTQALQDFMDCIQDLIVYSMWMI
ncbi:hypothetical protein MX850_02280 [Erysipelothrix sp. Poltava]|nr:hypothetical protein MX850_02280 [Erysipelothrix sp. Poltava]